MPKFVARRKLAMEQPGARLEQEEQEEEEQEHSGEDSGPEGALGKSPLQLTPEDVYDISSVVGRELAALGGGQDPRVARLQFTIVRVLELLETLVSEAGVAAEELRMERDSLRHELEGLRRATGGQDGLGPDKMVVDLADPNRPRFTLQELREVLQERNKLKSQLLLAQEELQCYRSGLISAQEGAGGRKEKDGVVAQPGSASGRKPETVIRKLFFFRSGKQT